MPDFGHIPVLLSDVLRLLDPQPGETIVDCTVGRGGHAERFAEAVGQTGRIIGFDLDRENLDFTMKRLAGYAAAFHPLHGNFVEIGHRLTTLGVQADCLIADLGYSSLQMDDPARGLSFTRDGPLDMRFNRDWPLTAADLLASSSEDELAEIIHRYGEEPYARRIARKCVQIREHEPIHRTSRLADLVREAYGPRARSSRMHPATRTFMALRIAVNDELGGLEGLLEQIGRAAERVAGSSWLADGARIGIISFHSLEDRMIKHNFLELQQRGLATPLTKKPIMGSESEVAANPRARSAKLRAARIGGEA